MAESSPSAGQGPTLPEAPSGDVTTIEQQTVHLPGGDAQWPVVVSYPGDGTVAAALRPLAELGVSRDDWDFEVLVDDHHSMQLWTEAIDAFADEIVRLEIFRRVRRWRLRVPSTTAEPPRLARLTDQEPTRAAQVLVEPGRPRLLLICTDGAAPGWRRGTLTEALRAWGETHLVAAVHMLPQQLWGRSGVIGLRTSLEPLGDAHANAGLRLHADATPTDLGEQEAAVPSLIVPVIELDGPWLYELARLISSPEAEPVAVPCLFLSDPAAGPPVHRGDPAPASPGRTVALFRAEASPQAVSLARLLAAAPLNISIMRLVQARLLPGSRPEHLAELVVAGLLGPVAANPAVDDLGLVTHEFVAGARVALLRASDQQTTRQVLHLLDQYLGDRVPLIRLVASAVRSPSHTTITSISPGERRLAQVQAVVLRALSGPHLALAGEIERNLVPPSPAPFTPPTPPEVTVQANQGAESPFPKPTVDVAPKAPGSAARVPVIFGRLPPRNPNFTGRLELLEQLRTRLAAGTTAVLPEALHGMGGVGKTQVVIEYVYQHQAEYEVIWWISAEQTSQIVAGMVELAQRLELPVEAEAAAAVPAVRDALRRGTPYSNWLLIFDNADSPEEVTEFFPKGGPGRILVTSRNSRWGAVARSLEVDVFERAESISLLRLRTDRPGQVGKRSVLSDDDANKLSEVLGDLPLAIEQAGAWLAETGMPAHEYLELFDSKTTELMEMSTPVPFYQIPVAAAWNVSLDHLARNRPAALRLLQLCAFLAPEPISRGLLLGPSAAQIEEEADSALRDPIQFGRSIREISRYALARIDHVNNNIQLHRLVQAVLVQRMDEQERRKMRGRAHRLLAVNDPNQPEIRSSWPRYAELYPHLRASGAIVDAEEPFVRQLVINEAKYHARWGDLKESLSISQDAYESWAPPEGAAEPPQRLEIGRWLGYVLFALGRYEEAASLNSVLLETHREQLGEEYEATFDAIQAVAADLRVQGKFQEAVDLSREVYAKCGRGLGEHDPITLNAGHNLAVSLRLAGLFEEARELDVEIYNGKVRTFGAGHVDTLVAMRGVLIDRRQLGDYMESRDEFELLAQTFVDTLGNRDPQTLETYRSLSVTRRKAGDHQGALDLSRDALDRYQIALGADNPSTLAAALNLSLDLRQAGQLDEAEQIAEENFRRFRLTLGKEHPHALSAGGNLAIILRLRGNLTDSRGLNEATARRLRDRLGDSHILTLGCTTNLASDLFASREYQAAHDLDTENLARYRNVLAEDHPSTLAAALNLAIDLKVLGRLDEATELRQDTVERYQRTLGADHPATFAAEQWTRANCDMDPMPL
ncbi:FxSxx-COOH system tetratricopeptide repeat protein [Paractinoplanes lichenicola]|uniref:Tetratricopeptide repeat protein n=1 Tax=Paractinoplanes lichenicola TaxID=2802976 RepID=A0ABS1VHQ5_9ACTN|nr:FxSxx-COOH system tetratricopeptide repeat protein [Actinoplanes lichenicola]MBL7254243.1 tetratricopeptide repeat protein [Actinoplanes lichenicola]